MKQSKKILGLAVAAALCLGLSGGAQAISYGVSIQNITNGQLLFSDFQGATGGTQTGGTTTSTTSASVGSTIDGDTQTVPRGNTPPADARCAHVGIGCTEDAFVSAVLAGTTGNYARADAAVLTEQLTPTGSFSARNFAEYYLDATNTAGSLGGNVSTTGFTLTFVVAPGTADFNFSFQDDPFLRVFLDSVGGSATAAISAFLTLTNDGTGGSVTWRPDGIANNVGCGTIVATSCADTDPFSLNESRSLTAPGGPLTYDPANSTWNLFINNLAAGTYTLNLEMEERSRGNNALVVPEPGTLAIVGLGLGLLGMRLRRRGQV